MIAEIFGWLILGTGRGGWGVGGGGRVISMDNVPYVYYVYIHTVSTQNIVIEYRLRAFKYKLHVLCTYVQVHTAPVHLPKLHYILYIVQFSAH